MMDCGPAIVTELGADCAGLGGLASGEGFDNDGDSLTTADARAGYAVTRPASAQFEKQSQHKPCSAGSQWMAERDRAAIDVRFIARKAENFFHGEILRGEGLVHFD